MAKAFRFRFETLLGYRRLREDMAAQRLARSRREVLEQNRKLAGLLGEEDEVKGALREMRRRSLDIVQLRLHEGYLGSVARRIQREFQHLQSLVRRELEHRRVLSQARKEVRVLDRLRERKLATHRYEANREEQKFLDEVARPAVRFS